MLSLPFKQLQIWQKSMNLVECIYHLTEKFPKQELYGLTSQMQRSAVSVASNIAEGSQRTTNKDFANFILTAKGSLAELETQLLISHRLQIASDQEMNDCLALIDELHKMTYAFHKKLTTDR